MHPHEPLTRREALKTLGAGAAVVSAGGIMANEARAATASGQPFELPKLGYAYDALEPHIDARTMEIHHSKHHQAYITNANNALKAHAALQKKSAVELVKNLSALPAEIRSAVQNNVGGHLNHAHFWKVIGPRGGGSPKGELAGAITKAFGSFDQFKGEFANKAATRFGSGWAWLVLKEGRLAVDSTANQDTPLSTGAVPLLGLDVWEHAYYLKYQNRRPDYVAAFWNVVNWDQVASDYASARG